MKKYRPFVLGINGSPHSMGITAKLLDLVLGGAKRAGAETRRVDLYKLRITHEPGLYSISSRLEVPKRMPRDDIRDLYKDIIRAGGLVLATPNYWANMSGIMKDFIDHLTALENKNFALEGKVGVFIAASKENEGGLEMAATSMAMALAQMGVLIPPNGIMWHPGDWETIKGKVKNWALHDAPICGQKMTELIKLLKEHPILWNEGTTGLLRKRRKRSIN
ncbi:flavodoxin family protein [Candidatus Micrarchaeota archaeon]|nr:flavodoxin family protein [Candidatus Micrarchaeota archaeon]